MKPEKITYTDPASVGQIIAAEGDGFTEIGLMVNGVKYPKGTVFEVRDGMVEPEGSPVFAVIDFLLAAGFERGGKRVFRRGDTDIVITGDGSAQVTIYAADNGTALYVSALSLRSAGSLAWPIGIQHDMKSKSAKI